MTEEEEDESVSPGFGEDVTLLCSIVEGTDVPAGGGGSIAECVVGAFDGTTGSGKGAICSSEEAVSIVIWVVALTELRRV